MQRLRPCRNIDDDADNLEQYAPPARRAQVNDADRAVANTVEGEIRSGATTSSGARLTQ
jgi:hypothetical protein